MSSAAFAAEGISKLTNKISLVIGTSGPGATNLITGIVSAYQDQTIISYHRPMQK